MPKQRREGDPASQQARTTDPAADPGTPRERMPASMQARRPAPEPDQTHADDQPRS